jgi:hypothetical protein
MNIVWSGAGKSKLYLFSLYFVPRTEPEFDEKNEPDSQELFYAGFLRLRSSRSPLSSRSI